MGRTVDPNGFPARGEWHPCPTRCGTQTPLYATAVLLQSTDRLCTRRKQKAALSGRCFNTSLTGYQEIMTDPSYAGQIITFTFPHIGNVGTNDEDIKLRRWPRAVACSGLISPIRLIGVPCGITMRASATAYPALPGSTRANSRGVSAISVRPMPLHAMPQMVNSIFRRYRRRRRLARPERDGSRRRGLSPAP